MFDPIGMPRCYLFWCVTGLPQCWRIVSARSLHPPELGKVYNALQPINQYLDGHLADMASKLLLDLKVVYVHLQARFCNPVQ